MAKALIRARPGAHTFVAVSSNKSHIRVNLQANRTYLFEIVKLPSPPFTTFLSLREIDQEREDRILNRYRIEDFSFSDEWRQNFANENNGRRQNAVRAYLAGL